MHPVTKFLIRRATATDISAVRSLIELSVRQLQKDDYSSAQIEGRKSKDYNSYKESGPPLKYPSDTSLVAFIPILLLIRRRPIPLFFQYEIRNL
jgi:hypothetical protein